jgi:hypothetical protein
MNFCIDVFDTGRRYSSLANRRELAETIAGIVSRLGAAIQTASRTM